MNMYGLPSDRKYLIETEEGNLMGICDKTNKLCTFDIIDNTYVTQIPSIIKLKTEIDKLPKDEVDEDKLKLKTRFRQENTMSKKYEYKSKLFRKIHQLQKRLYRTEQNPGHSEDKVWFREMRIKKLLNKIREK